MAWKTWKATMPRLLGKRANTKACRPRLPLQEHTSIPLRHEHILHQVSSQETQVQIDDASRLLFYELLLEQAFVLPVL